MTENPRDTARRLARWYRRHARALPWRTTRDPYAIWLSEVMAQQSARVAAVYNGSTYLGLTSVEDISEAFTILAFQQRQAQARQNKQARSNQI